MAVVGMGTKSAICFFARCGTEVSWNKQRTTSCETGNWAGAWMGSVSGGTLQSTTKYYQRALRKPVGAESLESPCEITCTFYALSTCIS